MNTVDFTVQNNLCISCGICKAVCPKNCISYNEKNGLQQPNINSLECIKCGKCFEVCPGKGFDFLNRKEELNQNSFWTGKYISLYSACSRDDEVRSNAVSGGVVTELVQSMLEREEYDAAFLLDTHDFSNKILETKLFKKGMSFTNTQKSRYLPVSHENAITYILEHKSDKIILVGTSCFLEAVINVIHLYRLNRDNYFLIGLFCDRTMNFHVVDYFINHKAIKKQDLKQLFFRSKEVGGWPGGVQLETKSGEKINLSNRERMKVKDYFQPERCLYCLDKLNMFADISVGDNYTGKNSDCRGSNSVIIRTNRGQMVWDTFCSNFQYEDTTIEEIKNSQHLKNRKDNLFFASIKEKKMGTLMYQIEDRNHEISIKKKVKYFTKRLKIAVGNKYNQLPWLMHSFLFWKNVKIKISRLLKRRE